MIKSDKLPNQTIENNCSNLSEATELKYEQQCLIKPINRHTIHKICSGQVVLSLAVAIKELVENAIDAGATNIEVKLKEYGSELIEVLDNGSGITEENFASLTLKHYTSKLQEFADLESVTSLGFRGEALSSLCALSNVIITTKHEKAPTATQIEYDHNGKIVKQSVTSRSVGTTVTLSSIFSTLPVRRKEFLKNLKREFNKMCQLLYAYCLVSVNIRITCNNQTKKGSKTTVMATQAATSVRENIINVFGVKQISSLIDIVVVQPNETILEEYGLKMIPNEIIPLDFQCFISSVTHGSGRSASDRQFYYINSRPCEPTKIMKLVNEIYRQFNGNQYPFVYLNIFLKPGHIDVNVTPDKRQIFLDNEKIVLAVLKASLLDAFKNFPSTYALQNINITKKINKTLDQPTKGIKRGNDQDSELPLQRSLQECFIKKVKIYESTVEISTPNGSMSNVNNKVVDISNKCNINSKTNIDKTTEEESTNDLDEVNNVEENLINCKNIETERDLIVNDVTSEAVQLNNCTVKQTDELNSEYIQANKNCNEEIFPQTDDKLIVEIQQIKNTQNIEKGVKDLIKSINSTKRNIKEEETRPSSTKYDTIVLNTSPETMKQAMQRKLKSATIDKNTSLIKFRSAIAPDCNAQAEQELQKQINRTNFLKMKIIGQFNLAFIIAQLENDLFIIDQHASDEKYNFEQLQAKTILETQVLVNPKELHLTAANECLLIDNEDIFKQNGFVFAIDHTAMATKKVKLTAIPVSKNYSFGKDDIDELLFMLQDGSGTMCRPSRVGQMFASRACRKSVMVGKALAKNDMRRIVDHMSEIDQPWVQFLFNMLIQ
ncbi:dna mismatch repair protein mlh pms mutl [Holotrichia oblita]|uniref:Dna mismatch repair protein mlh pms mutl n=1 Tax=Holotrichia oblita TaxID=644536 RepID=A0ACB9TVC1_HOLOL|nr:dna mismatch repair protein mlh pms mutl [Holotrichia oblita]